MSIYVYIVYIYISWQARRFYMFVVCHYMLSLISGNEKTGSDISR